MNFDQIYDNYTNRRSNLYAIVIYLPKTLDDVVLPFREKYDPLYNLVAAHMSIVFPFNTQLPMDDLSYQIKSEVEKFDSFAVELDSIGDFYPKSPVIYWDVKKNNSINELYYKLHSSLGIAIPHKIFKPHVTIAREISNHRVVTVKDAIVSYLPSEKFQATAVDLLTPLVNDRWVSVRTFNLKT